MPSDLRDHSKGGKTAMSSADWETLVSEIVSDRRMAKRVNLRYPVEISGFDRAGKLFCEKTFTTDISATGCRAVLQEPLERGDTISIKLLGKLDPDPAAAVPQMFQIAWRAYKEGVWMVGALKLTEDKLWHVDFPKKSQFKDP
ncbi:MAG: PilZ domain-containing protein [Candidatus Acidiferrales bacterium]